jgi:hypothetical protein
VAEDMEVIVVFKEVQSNIGFIVGSAVASAAALISTLILIIGWLRRRKKAMVIELDVKFDK